MKKRMLIIFIVTLIIDQFVKILCVNHLTSMVIIPDFLKLIYAENDGVAFSFLSGNRIIIILLSMLLLIFLFYLLKKDYLDKKENNMIKDFSFGLTFGGLFGNLIDRILRGVVIDYISLNFFGYHYPIFNIADISLTIGIILMIIYSFKEEKKKSNNKDIL